MLQSLDDKDATYRIKRDQGSKGFTIMLQKQQIPENEQGYTIKCPHQKVKSVLTKKRNVATFDTEKCNNQFALKTSRTDRFIKSVKIDSSLTID